MKPASSPTHCQWSHEQKTVCDPREKMSNPVQLFLACWPLSAGYMYIHTLHTAVHEYYESNNTQRWLLFSYPPTPRPGSSKSTGGYQWRQIRSAPRKRDQTPICDQLLRRAGIKIEIPPEQGLAMKSNLVLTWKTTREIRA